MLWQTTKGMLASPISTHIMNVSDFSMLWCGGDGLIFNTEEILMGRRVNRVMGHSVTGFVAAGTAPKFPPLWRGLAKQRLDGCSTVLV